MTEETLPIPSLEIAYRFGAEDCDYDTVQRWLAGTYWCPGISRERVERGFRASTVVIQALADGRLVGVARAVSDTTRFAYLADVYVEEAFRGRGIAREMVRRLLEHPDLADVDGAFLLTRDAHGVYEKLGFTTAEPGRLMVRRKAPRPQPATPGVAS